jgi:hypothetical protein
MAVSGRRLPDASPASSRVTLSIDEVVLRGFPPIDRHRVGDAMAAELTRLLGEGGLPAGTAGRAVAMAPLTMRLPADAGPEAVGREIARTLHAGLCRHGVPESRR